MINLWLRGFIAIEIAKVLADIAEAIVNEVGCDIFKQVNIDEGGNSKSYPLTYPVLNDYPFTQPNQRTPYIIVQGDNTDEMVAIGTAINKAGYDVQIDRPLLAFMTKPS